MTTDAPLRPTQLARQLCCEANRIGKRQERTLDHVPMIALPGDRPKQVVALWRAKCEEYRHSPEFAEQREADRQAQRVRMQEYANEMAHQVRTLSPEDGLAVIAHLGKLCNLHDSIYVKISWELVGAGLRELGYSQDTTEEELNSEDPRHASRWMASRVLQAISDDPESFRGRGRLMGLSYYAAGRLSR